VKTKGKQKATDEDKDNVEDDVEWIAEVDKRKPSKRKSKSNKDKSKAQMEAEEEPPAGKWVSEDAAEAIGNTWICGLKDY
jgi:hypothetical protein